MKILKNKLIIAVIFSAVVFIILLLNLLFHVHPLFDFVKYLETRQYFWTIPLSILFLSGLWIIYRSMSRKIINDRVETFNATIHTIQDILQNSTSSMQLLILDMKDEGIDAELISRAEKNIEELKSVVETLASVDPKNLNFTELNKTMSVIKMHKP